jgi:hypothetical protein
MSVSFEYSEMQLEEPGVYLTNGVFLYRVVVRARSDADEVLELEDCYRLDVVRVPVSALRARGLRVVTPAPSHG